MNNNRKYGRRVQKKHQESEYDSFCSICGMPVKKHQIAAVMDYTTIMDYEERQYVEVSGHFCFECWGKFRKNNEGGIDAAMRRLENLEMLQNDRS